MAEHLDHETLSALMDEPEAWPAARDHLRGCTACRREFNVMRRMRMALSALDDLEAPDGAWEAIEARLPAGQAAAHAAGPGRDRGWVGATMRAAAAVVLFAGGVGLGLWAGAPAKTAGAASGASSVAAGDVPDGGPTRLADAGAGALSAAGEAARPASARGSGSAGSSLESATGASDSVTLPADLPRPYRALYSRLEALRAQGPSPSQALQDPQAAAQHLARLDALIRASRDALQDSPADPAINDFLFQVVAEREALDQALHVASLQYR